MWKWANFLLLAGGLGYLIAKDAAAVLRRALAGHR